MSSFEFLHRVNFKFDTLILECDRVEATGTGTQSMNILTYSFGVYDTRTWYLYDIPGIVPAGSVGGVTNHASIDDNSLPGTR